MVEGFSSGLEFIDEGLRAAHSAREPLLCAAAHSSFGCRV